MEQNEMICPICGDPTNVYMGKARKDRLCRKHGMMKNAGEIAENEDGEYFELSSGKALTSFIENKSENSPMAEEHLVTDLSCIICGEPSNGKHFCLSCYRKYKDKSVDIRVTNCREIKILDEYGNLTIECDDGRRVRSRAEALIINFFYNNKIRSVYEKTVYYTDPETGKQVHIGKNVALVPSTYEMTYSKDYATLLTELDLYGEYLDKRE